MSVLKVNMNFDMDFVGELHTQRGAIAKLGSQENGLAPYDMLFAALASCLYATFLGVVEKKRMTFDSVDIEVTGEKRQTIPMMLTWCKVVIKVKNPSKEKGFEQAADLAAEYCSIYQTLSHVADMSVVVEFE